MIDAILILVLLGVMILSLMGIFAEGYDDNWGQRIGMVLIGGSSVFLALNVWRDIWPISPNLALLFVSGVCSFGVGTAVKVWRHRKNPKMGQTLSLRQRT